MHATLPAPGPLARYWKHDPGVVYLNHGSFGACPRPVLEAQAAYRDRMEAEAVRYFVIDFDELMDRPRRDLAAFINCDPQDLAFVTNATVGVATILENEAAAGRLRSGDEVIASAHEYPACMNNLRRICQRVGATITMAEIPFPISSPDQVVEALLAKVTPRTRLALVSHVTSSSGLVLPIERIIKELRERKVEVVVDGAHAPGFTDLDIARMQPAYYTANCHKWICSPKGSALLYVRRDLQAGFRPVVLSNFAEKAKPGRSQFLTESDYIGTADHSAFLAISDALAFMGTVLSGPRPHASAAEIRAGYDAVRKANHELVIWGRNLICRTMGVEPPAPDSMIGALTSIFLPAHDPERHARLMARPTKYHDALQERIVSVHRIQVPLWSVTGKPDRIIRLSAQVYNSRAQYEYLAEVLKKEWEAEKSL
ncbi:MAG TPA: aminotransferase class V-fold PLP-dependent enzyme [Phycisphaerales bacterium]|nr:aminotransferase class V-fold PLP-dependent enzyme [Phycisphaerales bacterium]